MEEKRLYDRLKEYAAADMCPMHMPGHKRQPIDYLDQLSARLDITEIPGFDNLHDPEGILRASMDFAARLYGAYRTFYLVNGSTAGILAAIYGLAEKKSEILVARNCHISVYNAIELANADPIYFYPNFNRQYGIYTDVAPKTIEDVLHAHPHAKLMVITSPTYEGIVSDIKKICDIAHGKGVKVIVDSAHGAHFGFGDAFYDNAVKCGADLVIQSLHKTLPSLTGTAIAHAASAEIAEKFERALHIFQTTSPSYLLLASIDGCMHWLAEQGRASVNRWLQRTDSLGKSVKKMQTLRILDETAFLSDPGKILIDASSVGMTGKELYDNLRSDYRIEPEMYSASAVLLMTSPMDSDETFEKLLQTFKELDAVCQKKTTMLSYDDLPKVNAAYSPSEAHFLPNKLCDEADAVGKICCEYICAYPPGIPIAAPGEILTTETMEYIRSIRKSGVAIRHFSSKDENTYLVAAD